MHAHTHTHTHAPMPSAHTLATMSSKHDVDFESIGIYVVGAQSILATMLCAFLSVALGWLQHGNRSPALRTLTVIWLVGVAATYRPLRITKSRGIDHVFKASRPGVFLFMGSLVIEQIASSCDAGSAAVLISQVERAVSLTVTIALLSAGLLQSWWPLGDGDVVPSVVVALSVLVLAMWPLSAPLAAAPFCLSFSIHEAGARLARGVVFAVVYTVHAYACLPVNLDNHDLVVVPVRASVASVWVLLTPLPTLLLSVVQLSVVVWRRSVVRSSGVVEYDDLGGAGGLCGADGMSSMGRCDEGDDQSSCASCASDRPFLYSKPVHSDVSQDVVAAIAEAAQATARMQTMECGARSVDSANGSSHGYALTSCPSRAATLPVAQQQQSDDTSSNVPTMKFFPRQSKAFKSVSGPTFHELAKQVASGVGDDERLVGNT